MSASSAAVEFGARAGSVAKSRSAESHCQRQTRGYRSRRLPENCTRLDVGSALAAGFAELLSWSTWQTSQSKPGSACLGVTTETERIAASLPSWFTPGTAAGLRQGPQRRVADDCCGPA